MSGSAVVARKEALPSLGDIEEVDLAVFDGVSRLNGFVVGLRGCGLNGGEPPTTKPSLEVVGALYRLADDLAMYAEQALREAGDVRQAAREASMLERES